MSAFRSPPRVRLVFSNLNYFLSSVTVPVLRSIPLRFAGDCVLVWAAYALPTFLAQWPGSMFCYRGLGRGDVWAAGCVTWFYVLVAVNVKLFSARPRTRLGRRPLMTRAVSSIRSPRRGGEPELTFFPAAASMPSIPIESPSNPQLWRRIWDYPTA